MIFQVVQHNSPEYWSAVELRREVLRRPLGLEFSEQELAAESPNLHCVLLDSDEVIASATGTDLGDGQIKIRQVAVQSGLQGQGFGRNIMLFAEDQARARGYEMVVLHARAVVVDFYLKLGYELFEEPFVEVGIPHRKMRKSLVGKTR